MCGRCVHGCGVQLGRGRRASVAIAGEETARRQAGASRSTDLVWSDLLLCKELPLNGFGLVVYVQPACAPLAWVRR